MFRNRRLQFSLMLLVSQALFAAQGTGAEEERFYLATDIYSSAATLSTFGQAVMPSGKSDFVLESARAACAEGDVGRALWLATSVVMADPNHAAARRVLGYRRIGDHWAGSYAGRRLERGEIWHPQFGWIQAGDVPRYQAGKRRLGKNRWITAEADARRHVTIDAGWKIRTDHFQVTTNHSREAAAQLASRLESLYQVWQQLFGSYALEPADLLKRFDGKTISGYRSKPFEVSYYRTRAEYNAALRRQQPRIDMTLGIYFDTTRRSHFFAASAQGAQEANEQYIGTINHEAVHQFFQESVRSSRNVGALSNAWLIEGVACYFESLVQHTSQQGIRYCTLGTPSAGRLPAARHRRLVDDYYVPLAELSALGITDFQRRADLPRLYSQSAGLVTFLMHAQAGKYRPALVKLLQLLYAGGDQVSTLEDLTGSSFEQLDREYRQYLEALPVAAMTP